MGRKRHTPEQIITALREAEVGLARGKSVKLISRELGTNIGCGTALGGRSVGWLTNSINQPLSHSICPAMKALAQSYCQFVERFPYVHSRTVHPGRIGFFT